MAQRTQFALLALCGYLASACAPGPDPATDATDRQLDRVASRPNFLLIVADDMGYTDLGAFGGEINTPNLDALAARGMKLTNFHSAPTCAPTRSMLLSGTDNHTAGLGSMFGPNMLSGIEGRTGYEGYLHERVAALPEILADAGYHTYMAGKWHLGSQQDQWPSARGFERSFALLGGSGDHFAVNPREYEEDGAPLEAVPENFYSTRTYTDKLISYIDDSQSDGRPFFVYAAYTSPHWPLQAPEDFIDRYAGQYAEGFDAIRARRIDRARELGVIPDLDAPLPEWVGPSWDQLNPAARADYARKMEIYAAMVENLDYHVGRLISHLENTSLLDNTVILFMSDNGAESDEMELNPTFAERVKRLGGSNNSLENLGRPGSWASYGAGWAQVGMASYRRFKGFTTEGGTRVPAFVLRGSTEAAAGIDHQYLRVADVAPTILELAGLTPPNDTFRGRQVAPMEGRSFAGILSGRDTRIYGPDEPISLELHGHRSIQRGPFKLVWEQAPGNTWWGSRIPPTWHRWQLFHLDQDPGETRDISLEQPELAAELAELWNEFARDHNVATDVSVINFERWHPDESSN
jgi:arylsulfatase